MRDSTSLGKIKLFPRSFPDEVKIWDYSRNAISKREGKNAPSQFHTYYRKNAAAVGWRTQRGLSTVRREQTHFYISPSLLSSNAARKKSRSFLLIPRFYVFFFIRTLRHVTTGVRCASHIISRSFTDFWISDWISAVQIYMYVEK